MDEPGYVTNCFQCSEEYNSCKCEPHETSFEHDGWVINEPNVDIGKDRLVNPEVYYGKAYTTWKEGNHAIP